jgi:hypothetical protein
MSDYDRKKIDNHSSSQRRLAATASQIPADLQAKSAYEPAFPLA